ncbi:MAG: hypothetical protein AB1333_04510 [Patescibacteria group bacterium]
MALPFKKWPEIVPRVRKKVQIVFDNGHVFETTVIQRGTHNGIVFHVILESPCVTLSINPEEEKVRMEREKTDNGPLWKVISDTPGVEKEASVNLFVLD